VQRANFDVVEICNGIPRGWTRNVLGAPGISGTVQFDGQVLTVVASGAGIADGSEDGECICVPDAAGSLIRSRSTVDRLRFSSHDTASARVERLSR
jgi:hypothetical protein